MGHGPRVNLAMKFLMTYLLAIPTERSIAQPPSKKRLLAVDDSYRREWGAQSLEGCLYQMRRAERLRGRGGE